MAMNTKCRVCFVILTPDNRNTDNAGWLCQRCREKARDKAEIEALGRSIDKMRQEQQVLYEKVSAASRRYNVCLAEYLDLYGEVDVA